MATPNFDKSMQEKKKRKANFTAAETTLLVDLVEKNLPTLRGKFSSTVTNVRKQKIWQDITSQLSRLGYEKRTAVEVRKKWRNMTQNAKKISSGLKKSRRKTGGGPELTRQPKKLLIFFMTSLPSLGFKGALTLESLYVPVS